MSIPTFVQLMQPTLKSLENLGGSGNIKEISVEVHKL
jgi:hypothetical protein